MESAELKAWRVKEGLTLDLAAVALGVSKRTLIRYEKGDGVPDAVASLVAKYERPQGDKVTVTSDKVTAPKVTKPPAPNRLPSSYDFEAAPSFTRGLERSPVSNGAFNASPLWDNKPCGEGWQRVPGCCRVVVASIVGPLPFAAPSWAGWRGVITASGKVYDYETGHEIRTTQNGPASPPRDRTPFQRPEKKAARR